MKRIIIPLLLVSLFFASAELSAEEFFSRITSLEELTEDAEFVIGAKGGPSYPDFYLLSQYDAKKKYFKALKYAAAVPATLPETEALVWRIAREGSRIVLYCDGGTLALKASNLIFSDADHLAWDVLPQPDGTFKVTDGTKYLHIYTLEGNKSYFKNLGDDAHEGTLIIYRRSIPLTSFTSYSRYWQSADWETLCLPFSCALPQGFEAYAVSTVSAPEASGERPCTYTPASFLEAGTAYVVKGTAGALFSVRKASGYAAAPQEGLLTGTYAPRRLTTGYVLDGTDFVPAADGCLLPAFCAFLQP